MAEYGQAVSRGFGDTSRAVGDFGAGLGQWVGDTAAALDGAIHQVLPAAIPTWLVVGLAVLALGYLVFRR